MDIKNPERKLGMKTIFSFKMDETVTVVTKSGQVVVGQVLSDGISKLVLKKGAGMPELKAFDQLFGGQTEISLENIEIVAHHQ